MKSEYMLIVCVVICYILWIMFTWGLFAATIDAFRKKQIWNTIYCGIGLLAALSVIILGTIKLIQK